MKTIGMIGGMSWESSQTYYRLINESVKNALGGLHSAKIILFSVDFTVIEDCLASGDWAKAAAILSDAANRLEKAGADFLILCTNTMHKVAPQIVKNSKIPFVHIADAIADKLRKASIAKIGLLGTRYTVKEDFYKKKLQEAGIEVIVPDETSIDLVNSIIFDELCKGKIRPESRQKFLDIIADLKKRGCQGIVLGCTEIGMLIDQTCVDLPVFDTTIIHAQKAVELALN